MRRPKPAERPRMRTQRPRAPRSAGAHARSPSLHPQPSWTFPGLFPLSPVPCFFCRAQTERPALLSVSAVPAPSLRTGARHCCVLWAPGQAPAARGEGRSCVTLGEGRARRPVSAEDLRSPVAVPLARGPQPRLQVRQPQGSQPCTARRLPPPQARASRPCRGPRVLRSHHDRPETRPATAHPASPESSGTRKVPVPRRALACLQQPRGRRPRGPRRLRFLSSGVSVPPA